MNNQRVQLQPAYLLHQRAYRDSSVIADVFSAEYGRFSLVARGARQPKSKLRSTLQPFQPLLLSWVSKGEMGTLTEAEFRGRHLVIPPQLLPSAFYLNELLLYLLHRHDPHIELFSCYDRTLRALAGMLVSAGTGHQKTSSLCLESHLRQFELSLLEATGYGMILDHDIRTGEPVSENNEYQVVIGHGVTRNTGDADSANSVVINGKTLIALANSQLLNELGQQQGGQAQTIFREAKYLLRTVIDFYLGQKTLRSREMYNVHFQHSSASTPARTERVAREEES